MIKFTLGNKSGSALSGIKIVGLLRPLLPFLPLGSSVVLGLLVVLLIAVPRISNLAALKSEIKDNQTKLGNLKEKYVKLTDLLAHQEALESDLSFIDAALPDKENIPELLSQIEKIASESGVSIRALHFGTGASEPAKTGKEKKFATVQLQAEADGSYANLGSFLNNLENASRLIFVDSLRFSQETIRDTQRLRVSLSLTSFYVTLPGEIALSRPVTLNLNSPALSRVLEVIKPLRIYKINIGTGGAGRLNPFE
ncbi:MAG: type 4a pilus biogenesis protein PilO [Patescibacteria group bacterium]